MASPPQQQPQADVDLGKLSYEIFSFLESKFLYGGAGAAAGPCSLPGTPARASGARVRVLAIDGCGPGPGDALLAAAALARLEAALRAKAGDPDARVADFFDAAAGAGAGGVLAAMLFVKGDDGRPRYTAADALAFVAASLGKGGWGGGSGGAGWLRGRWASLFRRGENRSSSDRSSSSSNYSSLRKVFGDATLRDTVAPLLVPCYDLATGAPFLFSRADAVESDSFDFRLRDVCAATCAAGNTAAAVRSVDGRTAIAAASGGVAAMGNPAAAAITHVLHNKQEFPLAAGVDDLLVVSIGSGSSSGGTASSGSATPSAGGWRTPLPPRSPSPAEMVRLTAEGVADMVDQAVAMAFGHTCGRNYVRIQSLRSLDPKKVVAIADGMLTQRNVEAELFRGRRLSEKSNREKLDAFAAELVKEHDRRRSSPPGMLPNVAIKQVALAPPTPPRLSSATTTSSSASGTATTGGRTASTMPSPASTH
ncbi:patatin-like protein 3 [Lolium rigidum]|uniref:patatin-like protein 3 n=1 Tax=Lolium rigidum TaxID=89674 RepID=UPI001F5DB16E|nr:patatin-like protein 3 [Lolium rigidum]